MLLHLKDENFTDVIKEGIVLVDFYADWCGPCKMLGPVLEQLANTRDDVTIVKINVDEKEDLAMQHGIMSIPALKLYKNGELVSSHTGFMTKDALEEWIDGK